MSTNVGSIHYDLKLDTNKFDRQLGEVKNKLDGFGSSMATAAKRVAVVGAAMASAGVVLGIKTAADLESARQGFITLLGSAEAADKTMARVKKEAARTPFEVPGLTKATQMLSSVTHDGDRAINFILDIGRGLAAMGRGQEELDRVAVNLQQIAAIGRAQMIDLKQFAFAGIPIFEMLTKQTGMTGEALDKFITDGGVTFEMLEEMFRSAGQEGGRFFGAYENQAGTWNQRMSNMRDAVKIFLADFVKTTGMFDKGKEAMGRLTDAINRNRDTILTGAVTAFIALSTAIAFVMNVIGGIIGFLEKHRIVAAMLAGVIGTMLVGAFLAWAVAATAAAIATLVALAPIILLGATVGAVAYMIMRHWDTIKNVFNIAKGFISSVVGAMSDIIGRLPGVISLAIRGLPGIILGALGGMVKVVWGFYGSFVDAGWGLITAFANGIRNAMGRAIGAVRDGMGAVRRLLPFSDAKEGPLKDLTLSGRRFSETFARGIMQGSNSIYGATSAALSYGTPGVGGMGSSAVNTTIHGNINIGSDADARSFLEQLSRNQELASKGVATRPGAIG